MLRIRLATKISAPFVALFAMVLAGLGAVLTREIFRELETRVEREQRFVLSVAAHPQITPMLNAAFLRAIRDHARGGNPRGPAPELVVFEDSEPPLTSLESSQKETAAVLEALQTQLRSRSLFPELESPEGPVRTSEVLSAKADLAGRGYLVLCTRPFSARRRTFFLLYPRKAIEAAQTRALWGLAGLGAAGLLLAVLLGALVARWISRPVRRLAATAARISSGGLHEDADFISGASRDEIGELARAFAAMLESLRRSQSELVKAERLAATGKLAASVAHEIRNPLTSMRMTLEVLASKSSDPQNREAYAVLLGEVDRLALSVDELLTFARPRPPQREATDLNALCRAVLAFLDRQLQHARVQARLEPDAALPADLPLDPAKLRQVLVNLLLNALQAVGRGGEVVVRTRWEAGSRRAWLEVADNGPGIPEDLRPRLFEPFVTTKPGGGGLGLAIARQIAEEHGGAIAFETSSSGTVFRVVLPAAPV
jgi:signal transduction histidine kinase